MVHSERESLTEQDPHSLLFGRDDEYGEHDPAPRLSRRAIRADNATHQRVRRHRRAFFVMTAVVVLFLGVIGFVGYSKYQNRYHPKDFSGASGAAVLVRVANGDGADAIGKTLVKDNVVASVRAFANAAAGNGASAGIQPGTYRLRAHMSANGALDALLDPSTRLANGATVFEGATVFDVAPALAKALGVSVAKITAAINDVASLNLPAGYSGGAAPPSSVEGFLYPATYTFDAGTSPVEALTQMISKFIDEDRTTAFATNAKADQITPYDALIIASIAEKEAKVAADYPKVARVILNRIAAGMPLQIDATSAYAAKQRNLDPTTVIYAKIDSPYNTYTHSGLPPTPISNPGSQALDAAVHPASGNWLYYVNGDKAGDLFFTNSAAAFETAVQACRTNHWGCG
ncbi:MAG: endolytic transglycosylase MltG [Actinomycetota bacterium]|nr:endolytic transglycosylase MltG [Actinomycetota bacterium]